MTKRRRLMSVVLAVAVIGGAVVATSAAASAAPAKQWNTLHFEKNGNDPTNSKLTIKRWKKEGTKNKETFTKSWRAGSGITKDPCEKNRGWIPNDTYKVKTRERSHNGVITGIAFYLSDYTKCKNDVDRKELFVHSEMPDKGEKATKESEKWDGDGDYKSNGCIKLKPAAIMDLYNLTTKKNGGKPTTLKVTGG